ncbi:efflux RND transporter periplasmic adaptor subunit [Desulfobacter vibrioformis]|uniref:efflux RND transporter periplasmic adaptor subunit n=1 Tax=Desulfobacter vibrioformis TaxID=34031 RepID=UPI000554B901|nr:efflux RND transporter periplasmic adaptor subunit [Desulfobacter vibrioformis]
MSNMFSRLRTNKWIIFIVTLFLCAAGTALFFKTKPEKVSAGIDDPDAGPVLSGMPVTITLIKPSSYPARITALGEAQPLWQSSVKARVGGAVLYISNQLQPGNLIKKGELIVKIDKTSFEAKVSETESQAAQCRLNLLKEEREAQEAQRNWKRSGIKEAPSSSLVLRKPQLEASRAALKAAQDAVANAKQERSYTRISAPFDGIVLERQVNPGETLFSGDKICTLWGVQTMEVSVYVAAAQQELLGKEMEQMTVRLVSPQTGASWQARVVRDAQRLDSRSRLHTLFLQVKQPLDQTPPLLPGTFVRAEMSGRDIPNLLCIPENALTQQGLIWFVDADNRLGSIQAQPVFYGEGVVYIQNPQNTDKGLAIAVSPNAQCHKVNGKVLNSYDAPFWQLYVFVQIYAQV